jgi:hypothetical protein
MGTVTALGCRLIAEDIAALRRIRARATRGDKKYRQTTRRILLLVQYLDSTNPAEAAHQRVLESRIK